MTHVAHLREDGTDNTLCGIAWESWQDPDPMLREPSTSELVRCGLMTMREAAEERERLEHERRETVEQCQACYKIVMRGGFARAKS